MNRGEFFTFTLVPDMSKLISEQLKVFTSTTRLPVPTCHIMKVLFEVFSREIFPVSENQNGLISIYISNKKRHYVSKRDNGRCC